MLIFLYHYNLGGHSHGVVRKNHHDPHSSKESVIMGNNHGHSHGNEHQNQAFATLKDAINKYDGDNHGHNHNDEHHSHDHNEIKNGPEHFASESLDLESEIKSLNSQIENKDILENQHAHSGNERHGHHGNVHEGHNHLDDHGLKHDERNNETESSNKLRQNNLHESMFLTLQNGR